MNQFEMVRQLSDATGTDVYDGVEAVIVQKIREIATVMSLSLDMIAQQSATLKQGTVSDEHMDTFARVATAQMKTFDRAYAHFMERGQALSKLRTRDRFEPTRPDIAPTLTLTTKVA